MSKLRDKNVDAFRPDDMGTCHYGSVTTQPITDTNVITFNDTIGLTSNPVIIPFREWEVRGVPSL